LPKSDALQLKGDVEKAEKIATELLDIDNTHIEICYQCANLFVKQEKLDEAIEVLDAVFGKNNKTDFQLIELLFKNAQHKEVIEKINTVNIEFLDILKQECLNIFQAIAIYNTQDKDSAYQFIDGCNFNPLVLPFLSKLSKILLMLTLSSTLNNKSNSLSKISEVQATAIYNTQDKDSAYQFIDGCNFSTLDNQLN
jgi:tetratricopeptide (TPR) repeat protein